MGGFLAFRCAGKRDFYAGDMIIDIFKLHVASFNELILLHNFLNKWDHIWEIIPETDNPKILFLFDFYLQIIVYQYWNFRTSMLLS